MIVPPYKGLSIDSRTLVPGNLFVAIKGEKQDGHNFIKEAVRKGAVGVVVDHAVDTTVPVIVVDDTTKTLGELGQAWREQFSIPIIALTGSNGKTTTKNMLAAIFKEAGKSVLATAGNLNNHWGVPIMLSRLEKQHDVAVIEMGMNHFGEISYLTHLVKPTVALIINAGPSHLEGVGGTVEGVAKAKGEIFEGLSEDGIAVINEADKFAPAWKKLAGKRKIVTFDLEHPLADFSLKLLGNHNRRNAQAAAAVALACGISEEVIARALEKVEPEHSRMELKKGIKGTKIIDDAYNANPLSLSAALDFLTHEKNKKIVVLGDMRELGEQAEELHRLAGNLARKAGVDILFAVGELTKHTVKAFGENAKHFDSQDALVKALLPLLSENTVVLVKGSFSMNMQNVVNKIIQKSALVVDDDEDIRAKIKTELEQFGYTTVEAFDGKMGVDCFKKQSFDLVTMDFQMPELNGAEAASQIRALNKTVPIVGLSSSSSSMKAYCKKINLDIPVLSKQDLPGVLKSFLK